MTTKMPDHRDREALALWVHSLWATDGKAKSEDYTVADGLAAYIDSRLYGESDPAYEKWLEDRANPALPATDDEWKNRLVEGGVA